jgi:MoxR-like ATPase
MFVGASNVLPEDEALNALLDRFLIRVQCDYVDTDLLEQVLLSGWKLENNLAVELPTIRPEELIELQKKSRLVDLTPIRKQYVDLVHNLRNTGIKVSDRRAVKIQNLIAASALMCGRTEAVLSDLWVLKYIWDTEEQIEILAGIIDAIIEKNTGEQPHPQALFNKAPNAEELIKEVNFLTERWSTGGLTFEEQNVIKDKLRYVQSRSNWIKHHEHKQHIQSNIESLWQRILQTI